MKRSLIALGVFALAAGAVAAPPGDQTGADEAAEAAASAQPEAAASAERAEPRPERKICRTERATGSLTRRNRICLTESQWREVHNRTKTGLDDFIGGASGGCRAPQNPMAGAMCGG